jgi:nucleotide-binding universal stress UspA family protein
MKIDKILVPLDGSALAEQALMKALELAEGSEPAFLLLRAAEASTWPGVDPTDEQIRVVHEAEQYLDAVRARLTARGFRNVDTSVWYGPPASAIVEAARVANADLVVMTTHGRSGLGRLILGSVAEAVLRGTSTPILLLRAAGAPVEPPVGVAEERSAPYPGLTVRGK